jgi:hypothetical protein
VKDFADDNLAPKSLIKTCQIYYHTLSACGKAMTCTEDVIDMERSPKAWQPKILRWLPRILVSPHCRSLG